MRTWLSTAALIVAAVAGAAIMSGSKATSQSTPQSTRIAFVDLAMVVREYNKSGDVDRELGAERQKLLAELRKEDAEIQKMIADLDLLVPGTREFLAKQREIARRKFELDYKKKEGEAMLRDQAMRKMLGVYTEIKNEAANYAIVHGYDAVLTVSRDEIQARAPEEVPALIALRTVIHWDKSLDITGEILKILNNQQNAKSPTKPQDPIERQDPKKPK